MHLREVAAHGGAARTVIAVELLRLRVPHDGEQIAADAIQYRLHQSDRGVGGDGGIDRAAAVLDPVDCDLGGERLFGRRHAVLRQDGRAGRPGRSRIAVAAAQLPVGRHRRESHRHGDRHPAIARMIIERRKLPPEVVSESEHPEVAGADYRKHRARCHAVPSAPRIPQVAGEPGGIFPGIGSNHRLGDFAATGRACRCVSLSGSSALQRSPADRWGE